MINFKQEQLIEEVVDHVRKEFPEVEFICVTESPEDPESLWIRVTGINRICLRQNNGYFAGLRLSYAGDADPGGSGVIQRP
jgi:hypothetical protein